MYGAAVSRIISRLLNGPVFLGGELNIKTEPILKAYMPTDM